MMEGLRLQQLRGELQLMNSISANKFIATISLSSAASFSCVCVASSSSSSPNSIVSRGGRGRRGKIVPDAGNDGGRKAAAAAVAGITATRVSDAAAAQLKNKWLDSLSCPFPMAFPYGSDSVYDDDCPTQSESQWVVGVDPDVSGAVALLKTDVNGCSAQVFDSPHLRVLIGKRTRRRLDAKSIVHLLRSFNAPLGTTAYVEQSIPYPQDGKQGWWGGGFGYGLWIGTLVASGFSVVPVPSAVWKNEFRLCGSRSSKDDSRELASAFFPSMCSLLKRKKDHGRAEALLIAAYGKGLR